MTKFLFRMQQLQTRIIMVDLDFEEGVHLMRSILKSAYSFFCLQLFLHFIAFLMQQVTLAYRNKLEGLKDQGLDEEEENKKIKLLKVSMRA